MLLSKKDTPKQYHGMWWAGVLNLFVSAVNLSIYVMGGSFLSLMTTCFSLTVAIVLFIVIKYKARAMLWDSLTREAYDGRNSFN